MSAAMLKKLDRWFKEADNIYTLQDVLDRIKDGRMQSFAHGDSWLVTEVLDFPTGRVLQFSLIVAEDHNDLDVLEKQAEAYAKSIGAHMMRAFSRIGWLKTPQIKRWKHVANIYTRPVDG